jgi:cytochrome c oxidase subunit 4
MIQDREGIRNYLLVYGALLVLTIFTTVISFVDLGASNTAVAILIAALKAGLVALFFMHITRYDRALSVILIACGLVSFALVVLTIADLFTR